MGTRAPEDERAPEALPAGTVSLLFTDIEGSTRMLREIGRDAYVDALAEHRRLLRREFRAHGGIEVEMQGDSFFFAFPSARQAVAGAVAGQRALRDHPWELQPIRVRMGVHTGEPVQADGQFAGLDVHRAARVMSTARGSQVLLSARTADLVEGELPGGVALLDLGEFELKDFPARQRLYAVSAEGLSLEAPPRPQRDEPKLRGRRRILLAATSLVVLLGLIVAYLAAARGSDDPLVAESNSVAVIDPATNRVVSVVAVGTTPTSIVAGGGFVWTLNTGEGTISRIDAETKERRSTIPAGYGASDLAYAGGAIWVANASADVVRALDDSGRVDVEVPLGIPHAHRRSGALATVALTRRGDQIWAAGGDGLTTVVVSTRLERVVRRVPGRRGVDADSSPVGPDIASGGAGVWGTPGSDELVRLDGADDAVVQLGGFDGDQGITSVAVGADVWAAGAGVAWQVRPSLARPAGTYAVGQRPTGIALGANAVWTANSLDGTVTRIDPRRGTTSTIHVGGTPNELVFANGFLWVTIA
jgi:YVTN family beta-propeller protein